MKSLEQSELFRLLPSVDEVLRGPPLEDLARRDGRAVVLRAVRFVLEQMRVEIIAGKVDEAGIASKLAELPGAIVQRLQDSLAYSLRPLINATGVILHTNLGRAPLGRAALEQIAATAQGYSNLEFDLKTGERGSRDVHVDRWFSELLDTAERKVSTIVVNNNAAAVLLALNSLAEDGEVIVSRGELVEIGGSFRIPDVMAKSGAILREVGTTNRTRVEDYANAINERTKLLLRVHRSNFQIVGFTEQPTLAQLVDLGRKHNVPVMEDLGSGEIFDLRGVGIAGEPMIADSLRSGVDVITYSGDKLLGGPQAGMISGDGEVVAKIRRNPLFRALRVDKMFYAALEATLRAYVREDYDAIPALRMMRLTVEELGRRAAHVKERLQIQSPEIEAEVVESRSVLGGGAAPGSTLPTRVVAVRKPVMNADQLLTHLRSWEPPIIARVEDGRVLLDLRTVEPEQENAIVAALAQSATALSQEKREKVAPSHQHAATDHSD